MNRLRTHTPFYLTRPARVVYLVAAAVVAALLTGCDQGSDNSDMPDGRKSGVAVRYDALTGCQYLEGTRGGLTPRMGRDGKQVCADAALVGAK